MVEGYEHCLLLMPALKPSGRVTIGQVSEVLWTTVSLPIKWAKSFFICYDWKWQWDIVLSESRGAVIIINTTSGVSESIPSCHWPSTLPAGPQLAHPSLPARVPLTAGDGVLQGVTEVPEQMQPAQEALVFASAGAGFWNGKNTDIYKANRRTCLLCEMTHAEASECLLRAKGSYCYLLFHIWLETGPPFLCHPMLN